MTLRFWPKRAAVSKVLDGRLRQSSHVLATAQGDELVLLDLKRERYFTLNEVGSRMWALLSAGATRDELVSVIRREYRIRSDGPKDPVAADVERLLAELHAAGLVVMDTSALSAR
jgi:hypothetical protein